jgi:hypothetical protein
MRLAEKLDLVGRISEYSKLDGLKGEPAVALRDDNGCKEIATLAGSDPQSDAISSAGR